MRALEISAGILDCLPKQFGSHQVVRQWIPKSRPNGPVTSRTGKLLTGFTQIVIGDTGWLGLTAREAAKDTGQAYGHFLVDHEVIIECVPALTSRVGIVEQARFVETRTSAGELDAHETTLAINLCFGGAVKPTAAYDACVGLTAFICKRFNLRPDTDVRGAGELDFARKDPDRALRAAGSDLEKLKQAVGDKLEKALPEQPPAAQAKSESAHA
ncbi:N-acetylmuramoyl-L-alanine amidase [Bradyrhizobium sp. JYMT SZCCT0180]|uniref:N-acetylmuramoyl-L-alanine amidase n=1 Tax=Bradyrhizobium sp. JYMT SZCCT0180 TaxID=2807666 RepID=UPI001BA73BFE|nr:N-acetylmuramoyl-L-alanine amidase [Bradyrhizobium sp. JYMT SZCCT0180]MBR1214638.1 N-acetylmuramoyl-L-alanine amidase [Bradyrhizobium sp. JYMT SZCCT0180]